MAPQASTHITGKDSTDPRIVIVKRNEPFFGNSQAAKNLLEEAEIAAAAQSVVLLLGETGTGKGVLARRIHDLSSRREKPFVELNCSALRGDLLQSELFGHAKGAFTSAVSDHMGLLEAADGATLFLDEIGDMGLEAQTQLLKSIEEKTFRRLGENRVRRSDFRLICATNRDLLHETEKGTFRKDLYYRICILPITLPPLRMRTEDIGPFASHLLKESAFHSPVLCNEVIRGLMAYPWPGNIRELRNMLERAMLLARDHSICLANFPALLHIPTPHSLDSPLLTLEEAELAYVHRVITLCNNDKVRAAAILGISLASLYRKIGPQRTPHDTIAPAPNTQYI